jgi:hypothetical protein
MTNSDSRPEASVSAESHWFSQCPDAVESPYEMVISASQAVQQALAHLGREASAAQVRDYLGQKGIHFPPALIERVTAQLTGETPGTSG